MKQLKISILTVLFLFAGSLTYAQDAENNKGLNPYAIKFHGSIPHSMMFTDIKSDFRVGDHGLGYNFGADLIYYFIDKDGFRAGLSLGVAYTNYRGIHNFSYHDQYLDIDYDNHEALVNEFVTDFNEVQDFGYIEIPIKLNFESTLSDKWDVYMALGASYGINVKSKYKSSATITRDGYYDDFNLLLYDVDVNGSPYFYPLNKEMETDGEVELKGSINLEASFGFKYKVCSKASIIFGIKYIKGLTDVIDESNGYIFKHDENFNYSLSSMASRGGKIKTNALGMEIGIMINIWELF